MKVYLYTGYYLDDIIHSGKVDNILENTDVVVDGPYIKEKRDVSLFMRGSSNQHILYKGKDYLVDLE